MEEISVSDFKTYDIVTISKTVYHPNKQMNRRQNPETDPHRHTHLIFDEGAKAIQWKKAFLTNGARATIYAQKKKNFDLNLIPYTKINSTYILESKI